MLRECSLRRTLTLPLPDYRARSKRERSKRERSKRGEAHAALPCR